jgi:putative peptidoglycan lipid II flippase
LDRILRKLANNRDFIKNFKVLTLGALATKISGYVKEGVIAYYFGSSKLLDVFLVASTIPNLVLSTFASALSDIFIPVYYKSKVEQKHKDYINNLLNILLFFSIILTIIGIICTKLINSIMIGDTSTLLFIESIKSTKTLFPVLIFLVLNSFFSTILIAENKFKANNYFSIILNITFICSLILMEIFKVSNSLIISFYSSIILTVLAEFLYININIEKIKFNILDTKIDKHTKDFLIKVVISMFATTVFQINTLVDRSFLTRLEEGSVSIQNYALKLYSLPYLFIAMTVGVLFFNKISILICDGKKHEAREYLIKILKILLLFSLLITIISIVFSSNAISVLFKRGAFLQDDVIKTSNVFRVYMLGFIGSIGSYIFKKYYYSLGKIKIPILISVCQVAMNIALNFMLYSKYGILGIAFATSLTNMFGLIFYYLIFQVNKGDI